jgi:hypothetical protein
MVHQQVMCSSCFRSVEDAVDIMSLAREGREARYESRFGEKHKRFNQSVSRQIHCRQFDVFALSYCSSKAEIKLFVIPMI